MKLTRTGKIARLPRELRDQLNRRLQDSEQGKRLVDWLNALPEVKTVLEKEFGGRVVSEQNLSEWKRGGYREWENSDVVRRLVEQTGELQAAAGGLKVSEGLATMLTVELARCAQELLAETTDPKERWARFQEVLDKLALLRREESHAGRLQLDREQWEKKQKEAKASTEANRGVFPIHAALLQYGFHQMMTEASPAAQTIVSQTFERLTPKGQPSQPGANSGPARPFKVNQGKSRSAKPANQTESNPIKPNQTG